MNPIFSEITLSEAFFAEPDIHSFLLFLRFDEEVPSQAKFISKLFASSSFIRLRFRAGARAHSNG